MGLLLYSTPTSAKIYMRSMYNLSWGNLHDREWNGIFKSNDLGKTRKTTNWSSLDENYRQNSFDLTQETCGSKVNQKANKFPRTGKDTQMTYKR